MAETSAETVCAIAEQKRPKILVVDSIQVMHMEEVASAPGSVSQVRESAAMLVRFAKQTGTVLILVGHVTKDGSLAGPKVLGAYDRLLADARGFQRQPFSHACAAIKIALARLMSWVYLP